MDIIIEFLKADVVKSLIGIILTAVLTYIFTKKSEYKRKASQIMEIQLEKVYLPLYILVQKDNFSEADLVYLLKNMNMKRKKYFLYISNSYLFHCKRIEYELEHNCVSKNTVKRCKQFICFEYSRLKKELGFPYKKEFGNSYFVYYMAKNIFNIINVFLVITILIWFMFGYELYKTEYDKVFSIIIYTIIVFDIIVCGIYFMYKILLYEYIYP